MLGFLLKAAGLAGAEIGLNHLTNGKSREAEKQALGFAWDKTKEAGTTAIKAGVESSTGVNPDKLEEGLFDKFGDFMKNGGIGGAIGLAGGMLYGDSQLTKMLWGVIFAGIIGFAQHHLMKNTFNNNASQGAEMAAAPAPATPQTNFSAFEPEPT